MVDHCTQHEQNPLIHHRSIPTNLQQLWYDGHKYYILAQSQGIYYMHQGPIMVDYGTKYEQNQPIPFWDSTANKQYWHDYSNFTYSQTIFYMHLQHMVPNYCTKYE